MAIIQQIRNNSWILIVMIALGLGGFLLMDSMGQNSMFGGPQTSMGEIAGTDVDYNEFVTRLNTVYGAGDYATREQLWNFYVREELMRQESEELGLNIGAEELKEHMFGANPDPAVTQRFTDPATRQLNREQLNNIRQAIENGQFTDPNARIQWDQVEREVIVNQQSAKLSNLISKGMYMPSWMSQSYNTELNQRMDLAYVRIPFASWQEDVNLTDDDYKAYINQNPKRFERDEETRIVEYITFEVLPTAADTQAIYDDISTVADDLLNTDNDTLEFEVNDGAMDPIYYHMDQLPEALKDSSLTLSQGDVIGPYLEGNAYKVVKILDRRFVADSVRSRHILRQVSPKDPNRQAALENARTFIDSLANLIATGQATFDTLAKQHGQDATAAKGGDLDYSTQGRMVQEFNDFIFLDGEIGKPEVIETQFGVHLVEVTDRKNIADAVRVGTVSVPIVPSTNTINNVRTQALSFAADHRDIESFHQGAQELGKQVMTSAPLNENAYSIARLTSGDEGRPITLWAFDKDVAAGDVSSDAYSFMNQQLAYENKFAVVALKSILPEGVPSVAEMRDVISNEVLNEKKGELIKAAITSNDLRSIANSYSVSVDTARQVNFSASFVQGLGREPKVVATAYGLADGNTSAPIIGNGGVYVIKVISKSPVGPANLAQLRSQSDQGNVRIVQQRLMPSMIDNAEIKDERARFDQR